MCKEGKINFFSFALRIDGKTIDSLIFDCLQGFCSHGKWYNQWLYDAYANKFLFISVIFGVAFSIAILYIPVINEDVFLQKGISWEWAIVIISTIIFMGGTEVWKWGKRVYFRRSDLNRQHCVDEELATKETESSHNA